MVNDSFPGKTSFSYVFAEFEVLEQISNYLCTNLEISSLALERENSFHNNNASLSHKCTSCIHVWTRFNSCGRSLFFFSFSFTLSFSSLPFLFFLLQAFV